MKTIFLIFTFIALNNLNAQNQKFAIIGDFGTNDKVMGTNESGVATKVNSWNPNYIITVGDNIYYGSLFYPSISNTYDSVISKYYGSYYTNNVNTNKFFPCVGNHDIDELDYYSCFYYPACYLTSYKNYFALPNNERYYTFLKGNIRFICINSDFGGLNSYCSNSKQIFEDDGIDSSSVQGQWCKNILDTSTAKWNIVYFHYPPYFSFPYDYDTTTVVTCNNQPYTIRIQVDTLFKKMRWPFKRWGADIVVNGHNHLYERLRVGNMTYIINGLGGGGKGTYFANRRSGSKYLYNYNWGAQLVEEYNDSLVFKFINLSDSVKDRYVLLQPKTIQVRSLIQGFYDNGSDKMIPDTLRMYLRRAVPPYARIDSAKDYIDSLGFGLYQFNNAKYDSSYYLETRHRNSIETWSKHPQTFDDELRYDFTAADTVAYGNNLILKGSRYCIYNGDINQDGIIDTSDLLAIDNDSHNFVSGYVSTDINGDNFVDVTDLILAYNNSINFIVSITP